MAMVHAAKMQAEASDAGIQDLIKKAKAIHKQLQDVQNSINDGGPRLKINLLSFLSKQKILV